MQMNLTFMHINPCNSLKPLEAARIQPSCSISSYERIFSLTEFFFLAIIMSIQIFGKFGPGYQPSQPIARTRISRVVDMANIENKTGEDDIEME